MADRADDGNGRITTAATTIAARGLQKTVLEALPTLTAKRRRLARLLLDDPVFVAFASAQEVGERSGVDAATVVRFSRFLGFEGFAHLKREIQHTIPRFVTASEKIRESSAGRQPRPAQVGHQTLETDIRNLELTLEQNTVESLDRAVALLKSSRTVLVLATGISTPVAWLLKHQLRLIGYPAVQPVSGVDTAAELAGLRKGDAVIAVSLWRYVRSTIEQAAQAQRLGASLIAITDSRGAPLAQIADLTFVAASQSPKLTNSLVGPIAVAYALVTTLALVEPQRTAERLARVDECYRAALVTIE